MHVGKYELNALKVLKSSSTVTFTVSKVFNRNLLTKKGPRHFRLRGVQIFYLKNPERRTF
jgi:hypothetical protein